MLNRKWIPVAVGGCLAVLLLAGLSGCKREASAENDGEIDKVPIGELLPDKEPPKVDFPDHLKTDDVVLNEFIFKGLRYCVKGDYDGFRQLFGVSYQPPDEDRFKKLWLGVKLVKIQGIYHDRRQPNDYYVHAVIQLRKADRRERSERQAVLWVFKEGDEWRLGPAPSDITGRVLIASTQPGSGLPTDTRPAETISTARPAGSTTSPAR